MDPFRPVDQARRPSTMAENRRFMNFFKTQGVPLILSQLYCISLPQAMKRRDNIDRTPCICKMCLVDK